MSFITLSEPKYLTEGVHVLKITKIDFKEDFQKLTITLENKDGISTNKIFNFLKADGSVNTPVMNIFSWFARTALQQKDLKEIDPNDLLGHFIQCKVEKHEYTKQDGTTGTSNNIGDFKEAGSFDELPPANDFDLDSLLG